MVVDRAHHAVHELLALEVPNLAQRHLAAEMVLAVCIAAGTVQRAFTGDFNRERRHISGENTAPGCDDPIHLLSTITVTAEVRKTRPCILEGMIQRRKSRIHRWGVFATATIPKNTRIIHYAGEKISNRESLRRERRYIRNGPHLVLQADEPYGDSMRASAGTSPGTSTTRASRTVTWTSRRASSGFGRRARFAEAKSSLYHYNTDGEGLIMCRCVAGCQTLL